MASMVTMQPSSASVESNSGIAVFSLDFCAVAGWPSTRPAPAAYALTRSSGVASIFPLRRLPKFDTNPNNPLFLRAFTPNCATTAN
jgi:hypothetical protein